MLHSHSRVRAMFWLIGISLLASSIAACPPWTFYNESSKACQCGSSLQGVVACTSDPYQVSILRCYCMTYNEEKHGVTVGKCLAMCRSFNYDHLCPQKNVLQNNDSELLNVEVCGALKRTGQLCGDCLEGYGPAIYSYSLECVECDAKYFKLNLLKYLCAAFLPLTLFYFFVMFLRISITSRSMVAYVFICQMATTPFVMKILFRKIKLHNFYSKLLVEYLLLWNLDFFRSLYTPFCLHPKLNTMQVISLDYLVAVYPLFLIVLTYIAVALHDRYPLVVSLWRPMQRVFTCIRKEWNIRGSLVQAFATFLVLSYVKILNVSFELLTPVLPHNITGAHISRYYLFSAGTMEYFGTAHLPYGILALMMTLVFNILPVLLLMLYPCKSFRKCLCRKHSHGLFIFMDTFHGCYIHQPKDYRPFAAVYFISRVVCLMASAYLEDKYSTIFITTFLFMTLSLVVLFLQPYKSKLQNKVDIALLISVACILSWSMFSFSNHIFEPSMVHWTNNVTVTGYTLFLLYGPLVFIFHMLPQTFIKKVQEGMVRNFKKLYGTDEDLYLLRHD